MTLCIIAVVIVAIVKMQSRKCSNILVEILYDGENPYLEEEDITELLDHAGISILGEKLKDIAEEEIGSIIKTNPHIKEIESISYAGTNMIIKLRLHRLLLHIYPNSGEQYFMDDEGVLVPYHPKIKEKLLIANGNIPDWSRAKGNADVQPKMIEMLYQIGSHIERNSFHSAQFKQIYINDNQEIELIPTLGNHIVLFGDVTSMEEKFLFLHKMYTEALFYSDRDPYKQLDVRFKNRIIAKKRIT